MTIKTLRGWHRGFCSWMSKHPAEDCHKWTGWSQKNLPWENWGFCFINSSLPLGEMQGSLFKCKNCHIGKVHGICNEKGSLGARILECKDRLLSEQYYNGGFSEDAVREWKELWLTMKKAW